MSPPSTAAQSLRLLTAALAAAGLSAGIYFAAGCGDGSPQMVSPTESPTQVAPTATPAPPTATPTEAIPTQPPPTVPPPTPAPPTPTPDTRMPIRDLPTLEQIQLGPDGKYFIADRGDGCRWVEHSRTASPDFGQEIVLITDCPIDFAILFRRETGEILMLMP